MKSKLFLSELNKIFKQSFKKIRIGQKRSSKQIIDELMKIKTKLKMHLRMCQNKEMKIFLTKKIEYIEDIISVDCAEENISIVNEHLNNIEENGRFSQCGMWKLRTKLCPKNLDPPTAKYGQDVTSHDKLLNLYLDTYTDRLRHCKMKDEYRDILQINCGI